MNKAFLVIATMLASPAHAQNPQAQLNNLPPNTVVGRLGSATSGPAQAVPISQLPGGIPTGAAGGSLSGNYPNPGFATAQSPTFTGLTLSGLSSGGTSCVQASTSGVLSLTGTPCGSGSGAVNSVSNSDSTLTIAPTTGVVVASLNLAHGNTWTATQTFNPPASSINLAYQSTQTASGAPGGSNYSGASGTGYTLNNLTISSDNMAISPSIAIGYGWAINHQFGGSSMTGARSALGINATLAAADNASNAIPIYVGSTTYSTSTVNDGGTNTGAGARGALFAENPFVCLCSSSATNWSIAAGGEVNLSIRGGSVANKLGWYVLLDSADSVNGANNDFAFGFMSNGTAPFKQGFVASDTFTGKSPIAAAGTFIGENFANGPYTITNGVDLSGWFFTGNAFRSVNFQVTGNGDTAVRHLNGTNATPTNSACAGFTLGAGSTDTGGRVSLTAATSCTINFGIAYANPPFCVVTPWSGLTTANVQTSASQMAVTFGVNTTVFSYVCLGA